MFAPKRNYRYTTALSGRLVLTQRLSSAIW
ncbi:hypothetical protein SeF3a_213 [Salmonella phage SeF3a]|nr:hypothetical protein SeF3a_213 [Salmonella phage SeF3a]